MPSFVNKNVNAGSGGKDPTSGAVEEQYTSGLLEGPGWFSAFSPDASTAVNVYGAPANSNDANVYVTFSSANDPLEGSLATPPGYEPNPGDGDSGGPADAPVAVTSGGITFNLTFDSAAPSSFRAGILQAASILTAALSDQITVNLDIHYSGTGGGAFAGPVAAPYRTLSSTTAALKSHASLGDTIFNALPTGSSVQGQTLVPVWNAEQKALGFLSANATGSDGSATFARDINSNLLVGVALHELTHAMGRVPFGPQPGIFDLFRFTSPGTRYFYGGIPASASYFSVDGGNTKLADYGRNSDPSDFLNSGVQGSNDAFNEFYTSSTTQQLSAVDLLQLDALGFHLAVNDWTTIETSGSTSLYRATNQAYYLVPTGGQPGSGQILTIGGGAIRAGQSGAWTPIGAEHNASGGYQVVWKNGGAAQFQVWTTDSNAAFTGQTNIVGPESWYVQSLESSFQQDLNGDGMIGAVTSTIEAAGSTSVVKVADSFFLYAHGTTSGPQLKQSGAYVQPGAWVPIGAEHNASGGYQVVWKNFSAADQYQVWTTDSSGNFTGQTNVVGSGSWYVQSLEQGFNEDLNGDGMIGAVTTTIEATGSTSVAKVADSFFLYAHGTTSGPQLIYQGAYVTVGQFGGWVPIGTEHNASGGYQVVWKNFSVADQFTVWTTDSNGNYMSGSSVLSAFSYDMESIEPTLQQDFNNDGTTGVVSVAIEAAGLTKLSRVANFYFMYQGTGASGGVVLRTAGNYVAAGQLGAWTPLGVEKLGSGYQVVWKNGSADQYTAWTTDSNGNYLSNGAVVSGSSYGMESLEPSFNQDFNNDGTTGVVSTAIEAAGSTKLAKVADFYFMYQGAGTSGVMLRTGGNYVAVGQLGAWTPFGVEQVGSGYQVVWKNGSADQYTVWTTDSNGNYLSGGAVVSGSSYAMESLEPTFQQDFNNDGTTGVVSTAIESAGSTKLARVADFYFMYQGAGTSGAVLRSGGQNVVAGAGTWTPLGAEKVGSGYQVVWKNGSLDQYSLWTTDSSGNFLSSSALMSGSSSTLIALEVSFQQNFNANPAIGATAPMMTSPSGSTDAIAPTMILSYGPADETGNDSSGSGNLALLTNYMASTFVPPAGEGTGAVAAAEPSDLGLLAPAKPS
jgi:serralysin